MKKVLLSIALLLLLSKAQAQFPVYQTLGGKTSNVHIPGAFIMDTVGVIPSYVDTAAASQATTLKYKDGAIVRIGNDLWMRSGTIWVKQNGGGAYVPLSGTVAGSPVTGNIVVNADILLNGATLKYDAALEGNYFGLSAGYNNTGVKVNANGNSAAKDNTGSNVNANGFSAGSGNAFSNVDLSGPNSQADANKQQVFNNGVANTRWDYNLITANRKIVIPNKSGTLAMASDLPDTQYLRRDINLKINISDSFAMLANYRNGINTNAANVATNTTNINLKLNKTDTAAMLTPYRNAINLKQNLVTLTTTGTSGASTFNQSTGTLNIPSYSGGGGGGTLDATLAAGNATARPIIFTDTTANSYVNSVYMQPSNFGTAYTGFGVAQRFQQGYGMFPGVNASGRPNVVATILGYNHNGGGGRENPNEAGFGIRAETHYEMGGGIPHFEFHFPEITNQSGVVHRPFSMYINKVTGFTQTNQYLDGYDIIDRSTGNSFLALSKNVFTSIGSGTFANVTFGRLSGESVATQFQGGFIINSNTGAVRNIYNAGIANDVDGIIPGKDWNLQFKTTTGSFAGEFKSANTDARIYLHNSISGETYEAGGSWKFLGQDVYFKNGQATGKMYVQSFNGIHLQPGTAGVKIESISEYADNAAAIAAGLTVNTIYRTGDILKIVR